MEGGARACGGDKPLPEGEESPFPMGHPPRRRVENSLEKSGLSGVWEVPNWKKMVAEVMGWGVNENDSRTAGCRGGSDGKRLCVGPCEMPQSRHKERGWRDQRGGRQGGAVPQFGVTGDGR